MLMYKLWGSVHDRTERCEVLQRQMPGRSTHRTAETLERSKALKKHITHP